MPPPGKTIKTPKPPRSIIGSLELPRCKDCGRLILRDHPREWSTDPQKLGLIHENCPEGY